MDDWMDDAELNRSKNTSQKKTGSTFRNVTSNIDKSTVRQARSGKKTKRRQVSQTIHLDQSVAYDLKDAVDRLANEWGTKKNSVWNFLLVEGLKSVENGTMPDFSEGKREIKL